MQTHKYMTDKTLQLVDDTSTNMYLSEVSKLKKVLAENIFDRSLMESSHLLSILIGMFDLNPVVSA